MERNQYPQPEPESEELPVIEELTFRSLEENPGEAPEAADMDPAQQEATPGTNQEDPEVIDVEFVPAASLSDPSELPELSGGVPDPAAEFVPTEALFPEPEHMEPETPEDMPQADFLPVEFTPEPVPEETGMPVLTYASYDAEPEVPLTEPEEPVPVQSESVSGESFMDRIPDVEEDYPDEASFLPEPVYEEERVPSEPPAERLDEPEEAEVQEYADLPQPEADPETEERPRIDIQTTRKGRPKRKKGEGLFGLPNLLATVVWLTLILVTGVTLGRMMWICAADVLAFGRPDQRVTVTIYESDTMEDIIEKLRNNGLIRYKRLFQFYADISDAEEDIKPGIYDLNTRYDYHALVNAMSPSSTRSVVEVTIPEGYTCRQIFNLLEENRVCTAVDIAAYAASGQLHDYWFLENVERGSEYCLEGFLFPDTYQFYKDSSPREALEKMLNNFDNRFTEEMRSQIETLNQNVTGGGYGVREVVIVASLIEKESASASESPMIASVIYNRLHNWEYPALLNIDAAIIYAQGGESRSIDTGIDSPYNTYRYTGLTPTPIANPGLSSLQAALNPAESNYYYYVLNPSTGKHQFSTTQEEHDSWIAKFYNNAG